MTSRLHKLERLLESKLPSGKDESKENKILAVLENLGKPKLSDIEDKILEKLEEHNLNGSGQTQTQKQDQILALLTQRGRGRGQQRGRGYGGSYRGYGGNYRGNCRGNYRPYYGNSYNRRNRGGQGYRPYRGYQLGYGNQGYSNMQQQQLMPSSGNGQVQVYGGWGGQNRGVWSGQRGRGACFACSRTEHRIAECPKMQRFQTE